MTATLPSSERYAAWDDRARPVRPPRRLRRSWAILGLAGYYLALAAIALFTVGVVAVPLVLR